MIGMQARLTNYTFFHPGLQATPLYIRTRCCLWIIFFPQKYKLSIQITKNTISTTELNYIGTLMYHLFLKSIHLKVPNLTAP